MTYFKRFLIVAVIGLLGVFAFQNQESLGRNVELNFFGYRQGLLLGLWLLLAFLAGAVLFLMVDLPRSISQRRELHRKSQDLARLQFELSRSLSASQPESAGGEAPDSLETPPENLEKRLGL